MPNPTIPPRGKSTHLKSAVVMALAMNHRDINGYESKPEVCRNHCTPATCAVRSRDITNSINGSPHTPHAPVCRSVTARPSRVAPEADPPTPSLQAQVDEMHEMLNDILSMKSSRASSRLPSHVVSPGLSAFMLGDGNMLIGG
jgi:hypothetical protein